MTKRLLFVLVVMVFLGCKDKKKAEPSPQQPGSEVAMGSAPGSGSAPAPGSAATDECTKQMPELVGFIGTVLDPSQKMLPPWPTGDAEFDKDLEGLRAKARELAKPSDPGKKAEPLAEGVKPGRLDKELENCAAAKAQIKAISEAPADKRNDAWIGLAGAIAQCNCEPKIPRIKALLYLMHRGPD
jgi:hypothetical protein